VTEQRCGVEAVLVDSTQTLDVSLSRERAEALGLARGRGGGPRPPRPQDLSGPGEPRLDL